MQKDLSALKEGAAVILRPEIKTLVMTGDDRVRFLNGMVTNDVTELEPGAGHLAVKTSRQGKIEGVLRVRAAEDRLFVDLVEGVKDTVHQALESHIIMDDCEIAEAPAMDVITVLGPRARDIVGVPALPVHGWVVDGDRTIVRDATLGLDGYELHVSAGTAEAALEALVAKGAVAVSAEAVDVARILAGWPIDGRDLAGDTIPLESAALTESAISYTKGCYIGQEVISKGTHVGQMSYELVRLGLSERVEEGTELTSDGAKAGEVCTVGAHPDQGVIALGYVKKKLAAAPLQAGPATVKILS